MDNMYSLALAADKEEEKRVKAAAMAARRHDVTIVARGCETWRDCYCLNTNGHDHHEYDSPWVVDMEGNFERGRGKEQPLEHPFRVGEDLEDYRLRMAKAEVWREAYEFYADMLAMPVEYHNPYLEG